VRIPQRRVGHLYFKIAKFHDSVPPTGYTGIYLFRLWDFRYTESAKIRRASDSPTADFASRQIEPFERLKNKTRKPELAHDKQVCISSAAI
jgi:hypothetical protein